MDLSPFRILSLCSGVGGIELGFKLAEPTARTICYVEIEAFACEILARRMEEERLDQAPIWTNLKTFDGKPWRGKVDCITGGYPCQPFSVAGRKLGDKDPRHLWPEIKRLITEIEPPICFFENVGGHLRLGFEEVANDLQAMGYKIKAGLFSAQEVGAPHKRERLFILAYSDSFGSPLQSDRNTTALERKSKAEENGRHQFTQAASNCSSGIGELANCCDIGCGCGSDNISKRYLQTNQHGKSQEDQQERKRWITRTRQNSQNVANSEKFISQRAVRERDQEQQSESEIGSRSCELANSQCLRCRRRNYGMERRQSSQIETLGSQRSCGEIMGNTNSERLEGQCQCECSNQLPTWPPSPTSYEQWEGIPNHLKPALHRMADGLANRVDEIRACGNGVVPLVAAYAWRTLTNGMYLTKNKLKNYE